MCKNRKKTAIYFIISSIMLIAIIIICVTWVIGRSIRNNNYRKEILELSFEPDIVIENNTDKIMGDSEKISIGTISDSLKNMGILITQEYYFTDVIDYTSVKHIFKFKVGFTESSFVVTYDGKISAGVNFENISVNKDEDRKVLYINVPEAQIYSTEIYEDSMKKISETKSIFNPINVEDFNFALEQLKLTAVQKAEKNEILLNANKNADNLILQFVAPLLSNTGYSVEIVH